MKMKNTGFTLIELLGVIVLLSIIVLVTTPFVQNKIEESRKSGFVSDVKGYLRATQIKNTEEGVLKFTIAGEKITPEVEYNGKVLGEGVIEYNTLGKAKANVWNGKYCVVKKYTDSKIDIVPNITTYTACMNQ
ncbi:MAG: prepilin-type N-terminal cleavage/methylation domain-containing protein [Firmicutes bacterium]|nr:prepilin-type N-terminal cleavage/methylation domain-containing protein [Bacillota bacterium]